MLSVDANVVTTPQPVIMDVGAAGKGYLVDLLAAVLESHGIAGYVINASGDILQRGSDVQRVGLEDPYDPDRIIGVANLADGALCASSITRRQWAPACTTSSTPPPPNRSRAPWRSGRRPLRALSLTASPPRCF